MGLIIKGPSIPMGFPTIFPMKLKPTRNQIFLSEGDAMLGPNTGAESRTRRVQVCGWWSDDGFESKTGVFKAVKTGVAYLE